MHRSFLLLRSFSSSQRVKKPRIRSKTLLVVGAVCLLGALALAGCGVTTTNVGGGGDGSQQTATPVSHISPSQSGILREIRGEQTIRRRSGDSGSH